MSFYKPEGYNALSPYLVVENAGKLVELLQSIFGARELRRYETDEGRIMHVEVRIDDTVVMLADATAGYSSRQQMLHVYVEDADLTFGRALAQGCEPLQEPKRSEGDLDKRGGFRDFAGNEWWIATQQED
ncbi:VOC family protein [Paenibacillus daejeonensis]|uniref:VOC family protein n=1 Tax=Paenibacillus daejeonensis TaxID=135193 RepID=UPI0003732B88|nr:VOC family protein [Paenibacillus daejeonensis]